MDIKKLLQDNKTDKESGHKYGYIYDLAINSVLNKNTDLKILEIGIGWGGSILTWCKFKKFSKVVGIDICEKRDTPRMRKVEEYSNCDIHFNMDAYSFGTIKFLEEKYGKFDIIIDDGDHSLKSQKFFFRKYYDLLASNGLLICEDIYRRHIPGIQGIQAIQAELDIYLIDVAYNTSNKFDNDIVGFRFNTSE